MRVADEAVTGPMTTAMAVVRFYLRPLRRSLQRAGTRAHRATWNVRLGPVEAGPHRVVLRSPRISDAGAWRRLRLQERANLEPWWASSTATWERQHTDAAWVTGFLQVRREARAGRCLPLVVEIDGCFAGQCNLEWIAEHTGTAEMGAWLASEWAVRGVSGVAAGLMIDYAMTALGVHRLVAPIATGNVAAAWSVRRLGMRREGTMTGYMDVNGRRRDHHLWALTRDELPAGGLTAAMAARARRPRHKVASPAAARRRVD